MQECEAIIISSQVSLWEQILWMDAETFIIFSCYAAAETGVKATTELRGK